CRTATESMGGSKPACITQLASMPVARSPLPTVRINIPLDTRPNTGSKFAFVMQFATMLAQGGLSLDCSAELLLDAVYLSLETPALALAIVELCRASHAVCVSSELLDTVTHKIEHGVEFALDDGSHRMNFVVEPALIDQVNALGDFLTHALAHAHRHDAHFQ